MAQRYKMYEVLETHTILVSRIISLLAIFMGSAEMEYFQLTLLNYVSKPHAV